MITVGIVIPCFNEARSLPELMQRIESNYHPQIRYLIVDNGSLDGTQDLLRKYKLPKNVSTFSIKQNQGYGYGILSGLKQLETDYVGWTHADLQTDPGDVVLFLSLINSGGEFMKGKRFGRPNTDKFFTFGMSIFISILFSSKMNDINAQPTIVKREIYQAWANPPLDFSLDLFAYVNAVQNKYRIDRQRVYFGTRKWGNSHWDISNIARIKFIQKTLRTAFSLKMRA